MKGIDRRDIFPVSIEDCPVPKRRESSKPGSPQNFTAPTASTCGRGVGLAMWPGGRGFKKLEKKVSSFEKSKSLAKFWQKYVKYGKMGVFLGKTHGGVELSTWGWGSRHLGVPKSVLGGECVYLQAGGNSGHEVSNLILPANAE